MKCLALTQARLRAMLQYDPLTGQFTWMKRPVSDFSSQSYADRFNRRWPGKRAGHHNINPSQGYWLVGIDGSLHRAHRLAWLYMTGRWPAGQVDHINGDRSDNRWVNLREVTLQENRKNQRLPVDNTSGTIGVYWHTQRQKWTARIQSDGVDRHLGVFDTKEEAAAARKSAEHRLPDTYCMICEGKCLEPVYLDGCRLHFSRTEVCKPGDYVALFLRPECVRPGEHQILVKRLVLSSVGAEYWNAPDTWVNRGGLAPVVIVEMHNPDRTLYLHPRNLLGMHKCLGELPAHMKPFKVSDDEVRANYEMRIAASASAPSFQSPDEIDNVYGIEFSGHEFEPRFSDGDMLIFDKAGTVRQGDIVAVWLRPELVTAGGQQLSIFRVQTPLPSSLKLPFMLAEGSECCPVLIVEGKNPDGIAALPANRLLGVHRLTSVCKREGGQS